MQYLIYIVAFIPFIICGPITAQQGVLGYTCPGAQGRPVEIPLADTKVSLLSACRISKSPGKKITEFPKSYKPFYNQKLAATSATGKYYLSPINPSKYPNTFLVASDGCDLAAVMVAGPRGLPGSQAAAPAPVVNRPGQSVRTRPGSPGPQSVPQSVRTIRPQVVARSESNTGEIEKREIRGSDLKPCRPKIYDWNSDISGTGRQVGRIPVPGSSVINTRL